MQVQYNMYGYKSDIVLLELVKHSSNRSCSFGWGFEKIPSYGSISYSISNHCSRRYISTIGIYLINDVVKCIVYLKV